MDVMVETVILFQITYFHYIILNSLSRYQTRCMLFVLYYLSFLCLIFLCPLDSVNSSYIQISQHHLQLTFLISTPFFSTKKVPGVSFSCLNLGEVLGKKMSDVKLVSPIAGVEVESTLLFPLEKISR